MPFRLPDDVARTIVDPRSYAAWDELHETLKNVRREYPLPIPMKSPGPRTCGSSKTGCGSWLSTMLPNWRREAGSAISAATSRDTIP
jgi:hypothetical protein